MASPFFTANTSTANFPFTSVAVVTTGVAPRQAATWRVNSLAPPMWPETREMANCPPSSTTTTAGSVVLLCSRGAMERTAIPAAPTNTRPSASSQALRHQSAKRSTGSVPAWAAYFAILNARAPGRVRPR